MLHLILSYIDKIMLGHNRDEGVAFVPVINTKICTTGEEFRRALPRAHLSPVLQPSKTRL
jgi:hypothetical protein